MRRAKYRVQPPLDGVRTTTVTDVAERASRSGHRVTAVMEDR